MPHKHLENWSSFSRFFSRYCWIIWGRLSRIRVPHRRPSKTSSEEDGVIALWTRVCHLPQSQLLYNPATSESFAHLSGEHPLWLFLESRQMRVINAVAGYDVPLSSDVEAWCLGVFSREVNRRRTRFKEEALRGVSHSLSDLLAQVNRDFPSSRQSL